MAQDLAYRVVGAHFFRMAVTPLSHSVRFDDLSHCSGARVWWRIEVAFGIYAMPGSMRSRLISPSRPDAPNHNVSYSARLRLR